MTGSSSIDRDQVISPDSAHLAMRPNQSTRGWVRIVLGVSLVAICLAMARWQMWRAETRGAVFEQQQHAATLSAVEFTPVHRDANADALIWLPASARGVWLAERTIFLDNKILAGRAGYHVITPLQLDSSQTVLLVNRGWLPAPRLRSDIPQIPTPAGTVTVSGRAQSFETRVFELAANAPEGVLWQHLRADDYRQRSGLDVLPVVLLQDATSTANDGLIRDWRNITAPVNPARRHWGYAAMWLVFALLAAGYSLIAWRRT
jgi:surfeit locus 1 family protein